MGRPVQANVVHGRFHAEGIEEPVIVVRGAIAAVHGHIEFVGAFDQFERIDAKGDCRPALEALGRVLLDERVRTRKRPRH